MSSRLLFVHGQTLEWRFMKSIFYVWRKCLFMLCSFLKFFFVTLRNGDRWKNITRAEIDRSEYQIGSIIFRWTFKLACELERYLSDAHVKVLVVNSAGDGLSPVEMRLRRVQLRGQVCLLIWSPYRRNLQPRRQAYRSCPTSLLGSAFWNRRTMIKY